MSKYARVETLSAVSSLLYFLVLLLINASCSEGTTLTFSFHIKLTILTSFLVYEEHSRLAEGSSFLQLGKIFSSDHEVSVYLMYLYMYWLLISIHLRQSLLRLYLITCTSAL